VNSNQTAAKLNKQRRRLTVTRRHVFVRGLLLRCPNCGRNGVFRGLFKVNERCEFCGFLVQREEGFFLGAMALNYAAAALPLVPIFVLVFMERISVPLALGICLVWGLIVPVLFYNPSRSLWMMMVYLAIPDKLPANQSATERDMGEHF
jgi:uncharacterized protein (DUF983 family)